MPASHNYTIDNQFRPNQLEFFLLSTEKGNSPTELSRTPTSAASHLIIYSFFLAMRCETIPGGNRLFACAGQTRQGRNWKCAWSEWTSERTELALWWQEKRGENPRLASRRARLPNFFVDFRLKARVLACLPESGRKSAKKFAINNNPPDRCARLVSCFRGCGKEKGSSLGIEWVLESPMGDYAREFSAIPRKRDGSKWRGRMVRWLAIDFRWLRSSRAIYDEVLYVF